MLEETVESNVAHFLESNGLSDKWAGDNLREIQKLLGKKIISEKGEITRQDVIEGMGVLARADFMNRIDSLKLPEFLKDFLRWARLLFVQCQRMAELGQAFRQLDEAGKLDKTFAEAIYNAAGLTQEFWADAAMDSTHMELARIAAMAVTGKNNEVEIREGAYAAWKVNSSIDNMGDVDIKESLSPEEINDVRKSVSESLSYSMTIEGDDVDLRKCKALDKQGKVLSQDTFITTPRGSLDWFNFPQDERTQALLKKKGVPNIPVRLNVGKHWSEHKGFGFFHVLNHFDEMKERNSSPLEFLYDTITRLTGIYEQGGTRRVFKASQTFKQGSLLVVDIQEEDGFYSIVSCYPIDGQKKPRGNELLIGGAVFRFTPSSATYHIESGNLTSKTAVTDSESTSEKALKGNKQQITAPVNIYDVNIVDKNGELVYAQSPINEDGKNVSFSSIDLKSEYTQNLDKFALAMQEKISLEIDELRATIKNDGVLKQIADLELQKAAWVSMEDFPALINQAKEWDGKSELLNIEPVVADTGIDMSAPSFSVVSTDNTGKSLSAGTFITKTDGNPDWFVIPRRAGQNEMPVRLLVGEDKAYHKGYGLNHLVASRVEDDLWEKTSPAKYISDILENASELYETSPGRELLVKGKQPSSWMVLQLDRQEGYYSIITAYPSRVGKKPLGRKIPLAERSVAQRQLPTNTESGTVRLEGGSVANAALQPSSAGGESTTQLPTGSDSVNIKDVICKLDGGGFMRAIGDNYYDTASFSVVGPNARNWNNINSRAFKGRDDGKERVELDSSQSSIKRDVAQRIAHRMARDKSEKKVRFTLGNVLDFPELYASYPKLEKMPVVLADLGMRGTRAWYNPKMRSHMVKTQRNS